MSQTLWVYSIKLFAHVWLIWGTQDGSLHVQIQCTGLCVARGHAGTSTGHCSLALNCFFYCLCWERATPFTLTHLHLLFSASPLKGSQDYRQQGVSATDFVRECTMTCRESNCSVCLPINPSSNNFLAHWSVPIKFDNEIETPERLFPPISMEIGNQQRRTTLYKEKATASIQRV